MSKIKLASNLVLSTDAATDTFAILAQKGGGKTYTGLKLFEEMHAAGAQCVAIDPVGKWWALRLAADGKSPGIDVPIFGGLHADLPLEPTAGALIARVIVERGISAVLDVSLFDDRDMKRFVTDFARELYKLKQRDQSVLHLFIEEASTFVPQDKEDGNDPPMLNAMKKIVRKGRNYGIGCTMIDQRAQDVNKKVLNQTRILIVLGTTGPTDRQAIEKWVRDKHIDASGLENLPSLGQGDAFVWLPQEKTFKQVHVAERWTFDASATPRLGAKRVERKLTPTDVTALRDAIGESVKRAEEADPKALQKRVRELEAQLVAAQKVKPLPAPPPKVVERAVVKTEQVKRVESTVEKLRNCAIDLNTAADKLVVALKGARFEGPAPFDPLKGNNGHTPHEGAPPAIVDAIMRAPHVFSPRPRKKREADQEGGPSKCALSIVVALMQRDGLTRPQIATLSGYSVSSSTFANGISEANTTGLIEKRSDRVFVTPLGRDVAGAALGDLPLVPQTVAELRTLWMNKLGGAARALFEVLVKQGEQHREALAQASGYSPTSSTYANAISELNTNGLIVKDGGAIRLVDELA